ncbi:hypothetical protein ACQP2U_06200 [Nocardia sp. CA-084685]|uniref:hypothetical protein n=1 Tax=Nocardia sp. CA-084685 TaxID=3239970 RepID=UPI003D9796F1
MIVLDSGALIGLEKRNSRAVAVLHEATRRNYQILIPATVLAQTWRNSPRLHAISRLLKAHTVTVAELSETHAIAVGALLAATGTADVVDAQVIVLAHAVQSIMVVTSDPDDLAALDPAVRLHVV